MEIISPGHHPVADRFWHFALGEKPNGARTLGKAQAKNLADLFEPYYDLMVTYASEHEFDIPKGAKRIAVMVHQNYPWQAGLRSWQKVNSKLSNYDVDYFVNEETLLKLIKESGGRAFLLPRFIDTTEYPTFNVERTHPTLWYGNAWGEFQFEYETYLNSVAEPFWVSHGRLGFGDMPLGEVNRQKALEILAKSEKIWAIGVSQLEARFYGAEVVSYRGDILPYYDQHTIRPYVKKLLEEIKSE